MELTEVEDEALDAEIELFFQSANRYREYLKRHHREKLCGVMIVRRDNSTILFSESSKYSNQICNLIWDRNKDAFDAIGDTKQCTPTQPN